MGRSAIRFWGWLFGVTAFGCSAILGFEGYTPGPESEVLDAASGEASVPTDAGADGATEDPVTAPKCAAYMKMPDAGDSWKFACENFGPQSSLAIESQGKVATDGGLRADNEGRYWRSNFEETRPSPESCSGSGPLVGVPIGDAMEVRYRFRVRVTTHDESAYGELSFAETNFKFDRSCILSFGANLGVMYDTKGADAEVLSPQALELNSWQEVEYLVKASGRRDHLAVSATIGPTTFGPKEVVCAGGLRPMFWAASCVRGNKVGARFVVDYDDIGIAWRVR